MHARAGLPATAMRRILYLFVLVVAAGTLGTTSSASGRVSPVGRIAGTVTLTASVPRPAPVSDYMPRAVRVPSASPEQEIANVVVSVEGAPPPPTLPLAQVEINQVGETFRPRVVAIARGSRVEFPNGDPFFHNVFSLSRAASFDLGRYEQGTSRGLTFDRPGIVKVFCDLHSYMSALILVFDHPYFVIPDEVGRFAVENVPVGRREVVAWHERVGEVRRSVSVDQDQTSEVDFRLPVLDP